MSLWACVRGGVGGHHPPRPWPWVPTGPMRGGRNARNERWPGAGSHGLPARQKPGLPMVPSRGGQAREGQAWKSVPLLVERGTLHPEGSAVSLQMSLSGPR